MSRTNGRLGSLEVLWAWKDRLRVENTTSELHVSLVSCELGDYANICEPCVRGSGLLTVYLILGLRCNGLALTNGEKVWPSSGSCNLAAIARIRLHRLVQKILVEFEAHLAGNRNL